MNQPNKKDITVLILTIIVFLYFAIMILLDKLEYDAVLIGVFRELLTIPALIILALITIFSAITFIRRRFIINDFAFYSLLIATVTFGLIIYIA